MLFGVLDPLQTCTGNVGTLIIGIEFFCWGGVLIITIV